MGLDVGGGGGGVARSILQPSHLHLVLESAGNSDLTAELFPRPIIGHFNISAGSRR